MSHTTENNILLQLTGKQTVTDVPVDELQELTRQYPAFGAAQFLLAKKTQKENLPGKEKYTQTAALHFANPYWFHFKLHEEALMGSEVLAPQQVIGKEEPAEDIDEIIIQGLEETLGQLNTADIKDTLIETKEEGVTEQPSAEVINENTGEPATDINEALGITGGAAEEDNSGEQVVPEEITNEKSEEPVAEINETVIGTEDVVKEDNSLEQAQLEEVTDEKIEETAAEMNETVSVAESAPGENNSTERAVLEEISNGDTPANTGNAPEPAQDMVIAEEEEHPSENIEQPEAISAELEDEAEANNTDAFEDPDAENEALTPTLLDSKISAVLQEQLEEFKKPVAEDAPVPVESEPYHTIDYFASQGIKLSAELQKQDHLAVKVKKFTDWLKQMKRINPTNL